MSEVIKAVAAAIVIVGLIFLASLLPVREITFGPIENIQGIPYPYNQNNSVLITEPLAHADVYLANPVLAQELRLEIAYTPINLASLAVGVREDSFWLSYGSRQTLPLENGKVIHAFVTVPLTDKLQETDRSADLMFFADSEQEPLWELHYVRAGAVNTMPTYTQFRNYIGSFLKRERAL